MEKGYREGDGEQDREGRTLPRCIYLLAPRDTYIETAPRALAVRHGQCWALFQPQNAHRPLTYCVSGPSSGHLVNPLASKRRVMPSPHRAPAHAISTH